MKNRVMSIGSEFPHFKKLSVTSLEIGREFEHIDFKTILSSGKWTVMFWWPKDFTFVCPTELVEFNEIKGQLQSQEAELLGASTDSEYAHLAWRKSDPQLKDISYPMIADTNKHLARELGILTEDEEVALRATFIVDPEGVIRWVSVNDLNVGRNVSEVMRVLTALQTGELTPCNWIPGDSTLS
ncbi:MAG: alkyl hydroperoxide reductase subunit AhpC [Flavobacteriales bacterium]|jgi:alkyl hydroperoxide reductase subunit AhpC